MESLETLRQKAQQALDACKDRKAQDESGRTIGSALAEVLGEIKKLGKEERALAAETEAAVSRAIAGLMKEELAGLREEAKKPSKRAPMRRRCRKPAWLTSARKAASPRSSAA